MRRSELKSLTTMRLADAESLLAKRRYAACYYLAGYAVECAIKACISKQFRSNTIPEQKLVNSVYQHNLVELVAVAGLKQALDEKLKLEMEFEANWNVVKDWRPQHRYQTGLTRRDAKDMYVAITDPDYGVLQWLQRHW